MKLGTYSLAEMLECSGKSTKQQLERFLKAKGYEYTAEGRGKNTIYTITKLGLNDTLGFKPRNPSIMELYIKYINENFEEWEYSSDSEVAWKIINSSAKLASKARMITNCRTELVKNGYIKDLQEQEDIKFFLKALGDKEEITGKQFYEICELKREIADDYIEKNTDHSTFLLDKDLPTQGYLAAMWESYAIHGKHAVRIKRREILKDLPALGE